MAGECECFQVSSAVFASLFSLICVFSTNALRSLKALAAPDFINPAPTAKIKALGIPDCCICTSSHLRLHSCSACPCQVSSASPSARLSLSPHAHILSTTNAFVPSSRPTIPPSPVLSAERMQTWTRTSNLMMT